VFQDVLRLRPDGWVSPGGGCQKLTAYPAVLSYEALGLPDLSLFRRP
jgi:hypothetical protein